MYIVLFLIFALVINAIYNFWKYKQCDKYIKKFHSWLYDEDFSENLAVEKEKVVQLVKQAGVYDVLIPTTRAVGYGQVVNANINPIQQFPNRMSDVAYSIQRQLDAAKGVYKNRIKFSYNPLLWIEFVIYLPSKIISYLGINSTIINKISNVIWWVLGVIIIPVLMNAYSDEISSFVKNIFSK